jgi:hypothetical protein
VTMVAFRAIVLLLTMWLFTLAARSRRAVFRRFSHALLQQQSELDEHR